MSASYCCFKFLTANNTLISVDIDSPTQAFIANNIDIITICRFDTPEMACFKHRWDTLFMLLLKFPN